MAGKDARDPVGAGRGETRPGSLVTRNARVPDNPLMPSTKKPVPENSDYASGAIQWQGFKLDGEMHGAWEFYRKDGSAMRAGTFDRGQQVGIWRTFDPSGSLVKETDLKPGR